MFIAPPQDWPIIFTDTEAPPLGRASLWAVPYAEKSIDFDDIAVALFAGWQDLVQLLIISASFDLVILGLFYGFTLRH